MKLLASQDGVRAWPGGFGFAKVGANYGPSLMANGEARARGYHQVLWLLDGMVTEAGASNFFVVWRSREGKVQLVTAPLGDKIILDGVTRRSILQLARERLVDSKSPLEPIEVVERKFTMEDIVDAVQEGRMIEAFAAGTAVSFIDHLLVSEAADLSLVFRMPRHNHQLQRPGPDDSHGSWQQRRICRLDKELASEYHVRERTAPMGGCGR